MEEMQIRQLLQQPAYRRLAKQAVDHARRLRVAMDDACYPAAVRVRTDATQAELAYAQRQLIMAQIDRDYAVRVGRMGPAGAAAAQGTGRLYFG